MPQPDLTGLPYPVAKLRYSAWLAYLDGRTKRAKELNKKADQTMRQNAKKA